MVRVSMWLPAEFWESLKALAKKRHGSSAYLVRQALSEWLKKNADSEKSS
jgi:predicted DNA-binding protein